MSIRGVWRRMPPCRIHSFPTRRSSDLQDVYVMNADGSGVTQLTPNDGFDDTGPVWSPDTTQIAFERDRKSTRLNSSHTVISYAVFCLKKNSLSRKHLERVV